MWEVSEAIRGHQVSSSRLTNQRQSEVISRGHHRPSGELVAAHLLHHAVHGLVETRGGSIPHNGLRRERAAQFTLVARGNHRAEPAAVHGHVHYG